jgi:hypothetical protein
MMKSSGILRCVAGEMFPTFPLTQLIIPEGLSLQQHRVKASNLATQIFFILSSLSKTGNLGEAKYV